jgi:hypothetical protein
MATSHGEGYAQIAWRMSRHPDLAIVRRFRAMNLQNILYLQAELNELEDTLKQQEEIDRSSSNEQQRWNAPVVDRYGPWVRARNDSGTSILAVNCGTVTFFPTHKLLGSEYPTTIIFHYEPFCCLQTSQLGNIDRNVSVEHPASTSRWSAPPGLTAAARTALETAVARVIRLSKKPVRITRWK